jgi:hypothetical protein
MIGVVSDDYPAATVLHVIQMQTQHFAGSKTAARNAEARSLKASALRYASWNNTSALGCWCGQVWPDQSRAEPASDLTEVLHR